MALPSLPSGYDVTKHVRVKRTDCLLAVGFDREQRRIPRFLIQLHYQSDTEPIKWEEIARMDHNETAMLGHNVYREGLHVDASRRTKSTVHLQLAHSPLPQSRGTVIRACSDYLHREADYFIEVYEERIAPGSPPRWPDGGNLTPTFNVSETSTPGYEPRIACGRCTFG